MPPVKDGRTIIELRDVRRYFGEEMGCEIRVINGVSLKISQGEFVAIMGPSGSGKSTLLNMIGCLLRPDSGEIVLEGEDIEELDDNELARIRGQKIGFIFQTYNLIHSYTAIENVELSLRINGRSKESARKEAVRLLTMLGLKDRMEHNPPRLSGGEQQRVAIARALANDPQIVLGDEPTGNLDSKTGKKIMEFLSTLNRKQGYTIVMVTHDRKVAEYANRIIRIIDGQIISDTKSKQ
jgi:putative ABC transport system ATP-binding protein